MTEVSPSLPIYIWVEAIISVVLIVLLLRYLRNRKRRRRRSVSRSTKPCRATYVRPKGERGPYYLFFDTETTGLPKDSSMPAAPDDNWPRLVQLSWIVTDHEGKVFVEHDHVIRPEGFKIPHTASRVHGITTKMALSVGEPLDQVLSSFRDCCESCGLCIGHNVGFDKKVVGSECLRQGMKDCVAFIPSADTMKSSVYFCRIAGRDGNFKWPSLEELYRKLFGKGYSGAHDSLNDVRATMKCFFGLVEKGVIKVEQ